MDAYPPPNTLFGGDALEMYNYIDKQSNGNTADKRTAYFVYLRNRTAEERRKARVLWEIEERRRKAKDLEDIAKVKTRTRTN